MSDSIKEENIKVLKGIKEEYKQIIDEHKMFLKIAERDNDQEKITEIKYGIKVWESKIKAIEMSIESLENDIKNEEVYWEFDGNGNDSGTELEIRCINCNALYRVVSTDEDNQFSYFTSTQNLDEHAPRECPNCKSKMVGWKKISHSHSKPHEMHYFDSEHYFAEYDEDYLRSIY